MLPYWRGGGESGRGGTDDGGSGAGDGSDDGRLGDSGGDEHPGDNGLAHQFLPHPRHYHWWLLLFLSVMLSYKISIENIRDIK